MSIREIVQEHSDKISITLVLFIIAVVVGCFIFIRIQKRKDNLLSHRGIIEMTPSLVSTLGVLGTFAGITLGLYFFETQDLTKSIPLLLNGLKTAFFTSLAGMVGSLILSGQVNKLFDEKTCGVSDSVEAAGLIVNELKALSSMNQQYNESINKGFEMLKARLVELSDRQLNTYTNSNHILNSINKQVESLSELVTKAERSSTANENAAKSLDNIIITSNKLLELEGKLYENSNKVSEKQASIESKAESILISVGNIEDSNSGILTKTDEEFNRIGEMMVHTEALASGQDEISKHVSKFGGILHGEILEIEGKMADTNKLLTKKFEEFSELLKKSNTEALVEVMKKVTEEFQKQMKDLIGRLVKENFEQLNKSVERLNKWQEENKEMIQSLTSQYKQMAVNFENTSTSLSRVDEDTRQLVSEGGKLRQIVDSLNKVIVEDEKFIKISSDLQHTANLTKTNFEQFDESTKALNDWVKKQRKFVDAVVVLIAKLDELNKIKDYSEQFWNETKKGMNEGVSIIKDGTEALNSQVSSLNRQFYNRLSTTLTELDNCIQALINRAEDNS